MVRGQRYTATLAQVGLLLLAGCANLSGLTGGGGQDAAPAKRDALPDVRAAHDSSRETESATDSSTTSKDAGALDARDGSSRDARKDDGGSTDGSDGSSDSGSDSGGNFLTNPGFENGSSGCGPGWYTVNSTVTRSTIAHSGAYSCMVCPVNASSQFALDSYGLPASAPAAGTEYFAEAWFRTVDGDAGGDSGLSGGVQLDEKLDGGPLMYSQPALKSIEGTWTQSQLTVFSSQAGEGFGALIPLYGSGCVLVDDVGLYQQ